MKEIIQKAMEQASLRYAKDIPRFMHLWDESRSIEQKAFDISEQLAEMGYELRRNPAKEKVINELS